MLSFEPGHKYIQEILLETISHAEIKSILEKIIK